MKTEPLIYVLIPSFLFLFFVEFIPLIYVTVFSFTSKNIFIEKFTFVGIYNFAKILNSNEFIRDLVNTLTYGFVTAILQCLLGFSLALLFWKKKTIFHSLAKALIFVPYALPYVPVALLWTFLLDPVYGPVNKILKLLGIISTPVTWLGSTTTAMWVVILVTVWQFTPFTFLLLSAALEVVPSEHIEAADVDGASFSQKLFNIILPEIKHLFLITFFIRFFFNFGKFDLIWLLTKGGPLGSTETFPIIAWVTAFQSYLYGEGCAWAVTALLILIPFFLVFLLFVYRR